MAVPRTGVNPLKEITCRSEFRTLPIVGPQRARRNALSNVMQADHFCMHCRGVKDTDPQMINRVMRGQFLENATLRRECLSLIKTS